MVSEWIDIEVAYGLPQQQTIIALKVTTTTTVYDAIKQSGIELRHPDIDLAVNKLGIYSKQVKANELVKDGDRIEIYRPLTADPRKIRAKQAQKSKEIKG